nr:MAG TPA: hypothetical protein [Caudoviricetes sp.]
MPHLFFPSPNTSCPLIKYTPGRCVPSVVL